MDRMTLLVGLLVVVTLLSFVAEPESKVVFLDVGQGDAILLQDGTQQVLIDGGQGAAVLKRLGEELPWFDRTIEVLVVTHPQRDHLEGLLHVLERYDVELVVLPKVAHTSQLQATWLEMILEKGIPYRFAWAGQRSRVGEMSFELVGPIDSPDSEAAIQADLNNASVMTRVEFNDLSFLLTGDAEKRVETLLVETIDREVLDVDVLKAGHHGSNSSTHAALLAAADSSVAVISVGVDNRFGHPHPAVLARLRQVPTWRTDVMGSIRFVYEDDQWLLAFGGK